MKIKASLLLGMILGFGLRAAGQLGGFPLPPTTLALQKKREAAKARYRKEKRTWMNALFFHGRRVVVGALAGAGLVMLPPYICQGYWSDNLTIPTEVVSRGGLWGGFIGFVYSSTIRDEEFKQNAIDRLVMNDLVKEFIDRDAEKADDDARSQQGQRWWSGVF